MEEDKNIDYNQWRKKCEKFVAYFEGYVRHSTTPMRRLITFLGDLEAIVFKERKTKSWS